MPSDKDYSSLSPLTEQPEYCTSKYGFAIIDGVPTLVQLPKVCGQEIKTMTYKGSGVCGEEHRKAVEKVNNSAEVLLPF